MVYKEINPDVWTYEEDGDFIEGVLIKAQADVGENKSMLYTLETEPSNFVAVWGSAVLDQRMSLVKVGQKIKITFKGLGEKKFGKNPPKIFKVEVDEPEGAFPYLEEASKLQDQTLE